MVKNVVSAYQQYISPRQATSFSTVFVRLLMSNRRQNRVQAQEFIDNLKPLLHPNSYKLYLSGSIHDIQVGMRAIKQNRYSFRRQ